MAEIRARRRFGVSDLLLALPLVLGGSLLFAVGFTALLYGGDRLLQHLIILSDTWLPQAPWSWTSLLQPWWLVPWGLRVMRPVLHSYQQTSGLFLSVNYGTLAMVGLIAWGGLTLLISLRLLLAFVGPVLACFLPGYRRQALASVIEALGTCLVGWAAVPVLLFPWAAEVHDLVAGHVLVFSVLIVCLLAWVMPEQLAAVVTGRRHEG